MKLLFFDLETTGLPQTIDFHTYHSYKEVAYYENSRIVQIAAVLYERVGDEFVKTVEHDYIIKPDKFEIKNSNIHGIEQKTADFAGIELTQAIEFLRKDLESADLLIAHNIKFDKNVLLSELYRYKLFQDCKTINSIPIFCTSENCKDITKIKYKTGSRFKQPKLIELYEFLFNEIPDGLHNALQDTRVLAKCFFELLKKKYFVLDC